MKSVKQLTALLLILLFPINSHAFIWSYIATKSIEGRVQKQWVKSKQLEIQKMILNERVKTKGVRNAYSSFGGTQITYKGFSQKQMQEQGYVNVINVGRNVKMSDMAEFDGRPPGDYLIVQKKSSRFLKLNSKKNAALHLRVSNSGATIVLDLWNLPTVTFLEAWKEDTPIMTLAGIADAFTIAGAADALTRGQVTGWFGPKTETRTVTKTTRPLSAKSAAAADPADQTAVSDTGDSTNIKIVGDGNIIYYKAIE